uniref:Uncharacterized protein n=1 Tax=Arundo donax TaxID=35708 RepID=A0A0A9CX18_ARUDO
MHEQLGAEATSFSPGTTRFDLGFCDKIITSPLTVNISLWPHKKGISCFFMYKMVLKVRWCNVSRQSYYIASCPCRKAVL